AAIILSVHRGVFLLLLLTSSIAWLALSWARKHEEATREKRSETLSKLVTIMEETRRPSSAKDIRLYGAFEWLGGLIDDLLAKHARGEDAVFKQYMKAQWADAVLLLIRDGAAYALLIAQVINGNLSLGNFVMAFAAIGALAGWLSGMMAALNDIGKSSVQLADITRYHEYPDRMNTGKGIPLPAVSDAPPSITLRDVTFRYPNAETPTLNKINLEIKSGERLAVVGANGAGKTTLIKIICGLCLPDTGEVLLNDRRMPDFNRDDYYRLFSPVFQEIHLMSSDISANISQVTPEETDAEKVARAIDLAGLRSKVNSLPNGEKTLLVRAIHADAIELSGGEKQKLALARALYKDAPILILDEPTAALDPIAENEIYKEYADLTRGKTSVYISHRLASTRFCDRIILLDGNVIAEQGTHDELIQMNGIYARMFSIQSSYYREEAAGDA
ncbi:MAG: ABC transporter ATP-binding protein/permease, partial [Clostridia bacterium]|nr:ABC transporter ATP-binding protein/permease [Clostridia bacterium]